MEGPPIPSPPPAWRPPIESQPPVAPLQSIEKKTARLPALGFLDLEKIKREQELDPKRTAVTSSTPAASQPPLPSPQSMYTIPQGPPPPYSYPSSATSSGIGFPGYISPPDSRRVSDDDKDHQPSRQSLPSIHEALGKDKSILYPNPPHSASVTTQSPLPATAISPSTPIPRSHPETVLSGPSNPYAPTQHPLPYPSEPPDKRPYPPFRTTSVSEEQPQSASRFPTHEPTPALGNDAQTSPTSMRRSSPPPVTAAQFGSTFNSSSQHVPPVQAPQLVTSQTTYQTHPPAFSYPPTSANSLSNSHFPSSSPWRSDGFEIDRAEEGRKAASRRSPVSQPYGESVKRHLEIFDLETALNEIAEGSGRALDFSRHHGAKAHQAQRSGPLSALPTLAECDDMIRRQNSVLNAMDRIRDVVLAQQHALAEQRSRDEASKARQSELNEEALHFHEKQEGGGGFAGADPKKRRGRNAPPGRCHSCNRAETPEWRRGPDGARTLCNACGLHYAKLTRKLGPKASFGSSNLRPKETGPSP